MYSSQASRGFTLIELLVVIAIIAILAAILFPVFPRAREKARQTTCMSNQRQIAAAVLMYVQDHDETFPSEAAMWQAVNFSPQELICPDKGGLANTYLYNHNLSNIALGSIPSPSDVFCTIEGTHIGTPNSNPPTFSNVAYGISDIEYRHNGQFNASYCDGHCLTTTDPGELGAVAWFRADSGVAVTTGLKLTSWASYNSNASLSNVAVNEYYVPSGLKGIDTVDFPSGAGMNAQGGWSAATNITYFTIFEVFATVGQPTQTNYLAAFTCNGSSQSRYLAITNGKLKLNSQTRYVSIANGRINLRLSNENITVSSPGSSYHDDRLHLLTISSSNAGTVMTIDGNPSTTVATAIPTTAITIGGLALGYWPGGGNGAGQTQYAEVIFYPQVLSSADMYNMVVSLRSKYGI